MSDVPQGPDWWRASNGLYYPPEAKPGGSGAASEGRWADPPDDADDPTLPDGFDVGGYDDEPDDDPEADAVRRGWVVPAVLVVVLLLVLAVAGVWWLLEGDDDEPASTTTAPETTGTLSTDTESDTTDDPDTTDDTDDTTATTVDDSEVSAFDLGVGDCFDVTESEGADGAVVETVTLVGCDEPHRAEVFAIERLDADDDEPFPGVEARDTDAMALCEPGFEEFVGISAAESELALVWLAPTEESWADGDREVTCAVSAVDDEQLTESVAGSER